MRKISPPNRCHFSRPLRLEQLEERTVLTAGTLDPSFGNGGKVLTDFGNSFDGSWGDQSLALQADGKIVAVGRFDELFVVARYHSDGTLDPSFGTGGRVTIDFGPDYPDHQFATSVAIQADGRIVVAGFMYLFGAYSDIGVARLNPDGSLDTTFDTDGKQTVDFGSSNDQVWGVALQTDGKIVIAGTAFEDFAVARLNADGSLDATFATDGKQTVDFGSNDDYAYGVALQADGKIVVAGNSYSPTSEGDFAIARLNTDGSLDTTFDADGRQTLHNGSSGREPTGFAVQTDGKIVLGGYAHQGDTGFDFVVARFNTDGSLDTSFDGDGIQTVDFGSYDFAYGVALQADGKIAVSGYVYRDETTGFDIAVARLNTNGSLDASFGVSGKATTDLGSYGDFGAGIVIQPDGMIIVAGESYQGATLTDIALVRYIGSSNSAPSAAADAAAASEDEAVTINVLGNDADPDGDTVTVLSFTEPAHGTVTLNPNGTFTYTSDGCCAAASDQFTYTISDGHGGTATATVTILLEEDPGVSLSGGILRVWGASGPDAITVSGSNLMVNGVAHSLAGVSEVRVWGRDGNDTIDLGALAIKTLVHGGQGHDLLTGGSAEDVIFGALGDDTITGSAGNDFLIGGLGRDRIVGSAGHDILVAGDIGCELDLAALRAISQAWADSHSPTSAEEIEGTLDESLVDGESDVLTGSAGADLFFVHDGDKITDFQVGKPKTNKDGDVVVTQ